MSAQPSRLPPAPAPRTRSRGLDTVVLALGSLLLVAFVLRAARDTGDGAAQRLFATWVSDAIVLCAAVVCTRRAALDRRDRAMWAFAAAGIASWGLGNAYFEHALAAGVSLTNPSPADVGYIGFYPFMYAAVIAARRRDGAHLSAGLWLDGAIAAVACATFGAAFVLGPVVTDTAGESLAGALTNIAYPIGDLTLLAMLLVTSATVGWRGSRGLLLLAAGMAIFAIADTLYLVQNAQDTYRPGGVLDSGWLLALLAIAAGAAYSAARPDPRRVQPNPAVSRERAIVPVAAGLAALLILSLQPLASFNAAGQICAAATLALVLTRMAFSQRETAQLLIEREREASEDPLTGLANRRVLLGDLARAADASADREQQALLVLFDLDGFKAYNDAFGHSAGDELLVQIGTSLRHAVGEDGRAYRIGGDEFCALLSTATQDECQVATPTTPAGERTEDGESGFRADRLGEQIARAMTVKGAAFSITASFGCAAMPDDGTDAATLLRRADEQMYARKADLYAGRTEPYANIRSCVGPTSASKPTAAAGSPATATPR
jgi:diguanylate cyclase (GGDEF)-like protein